LKLKKSNQTTNKSNLLLISVINFFSIPRLLQKDDEGKFSLNLSLSDGSGNEEDLEERLITEARNKFLKAMRVTPSFEMSSFSHFTGRILSII